MSKIVSKHMEGRTIKEVVIMNSVMCITFTDRTSVTVSAHPDKVMAARLVTSVSQPRLVVDPQQFIGGHK